MTRITLNYTILKVFITWIKFTQNTARFSWNSAEVYWSLLMFYGEPLSV